jgi:hypothetical protein
MSQEVDSLLDEMRKQHDMDIMKVRNLTPEGIPLGAEIIL